MATGQQISGRYKVLTCAICLEILQDPVVFPCVHHFCKTCKDQLKIREKEGTQGVSCPSCQAFVSLNSIKEDSIMQKIVEVQSKRTNYCSEPQICQFCSNEKSLFRCFQCKSDMCNVCKNGHLGIPACKGHIVKPLSECRTVLVDSVVFCKIHTDKLLEFSCVLCNQTICYRCKILNHDNHKTQTIEEAIEALLPLIRKKLKPISKDISHLIETVNYLEEIATITQRQQEKLEIAILNKRDELDRKLSADAEQLTIGVKRAFQAKFKEIESERVRLMHMLSSKESVQDRVTTLLCYLHDVNLLLQLQGDIMSTLEQHQTSCVDQIIQIPEFKKELQYTQYEEENMIAELRDDSVKNINKTERFKELQTENDELHKTLKKEKDKYEKVHQDYFIEKIKAQTLQKEKDNLEKELKAEREKVNNFEYKIKNMQQVTEKSKSILEECCSVLSPPSPRTDPFGSYTSPVHHRSGGFSPQSFGGHFETTHQRLLKKINELLNQ